MLDRLSRKTICRTTRLAPRHARCVASFTCCYTVCGTGQLRTSTTRAKLWLQRLGDGLSPLPPSLSPPPHPPPPSPCCCAGKSSSLCNTNSRASFSGEANVVVVPFSQQCKVSVTSFSPLNMLSLLGCGVGGGGGVRGGR